MSGSVALTSKRKELTRRDAASEPSTPTPHPSRASLAPEMRTSWAMLVRVAPSAMRMAISCVRSYTEKATTA